MHKGPCKWEGVSIWHKKKINKFIHLKRKKNYIHFYSCVRTSENFICLKRPSYAINKNKEICIYVTNKSIKGPIYHTQKTLTGLHLPTGVQAGNAAQVPSAWQVAVPSPSYPVLQLTVAEPAYKVEPDRAPLVIVGVPQSGMFI